MLEGTGYPKKGEQFSGSSLDRINRSTRRLGVRHGGRAAVQLRGFGIVCADYRPAGDLGGATRCDRHRSLRGSCGLKSLVRKSG